MNNQEKKPKRCKYQKTCPDYQSILFNSEEITPDECVFMAAGKCCFSQSKHCGEKVVEE